MRPAIERALLSAVRVLLYPRAATPEASRIGSITAVTAAVTGKIDVRDESKLNTITP